MTFSRRKIRSDSLTTAIDGAQRAKAMNLCVSIDATLVQWLRDQAAHRGVPVSRIVAGCIVVAASAGSARPGRLVQPPVLLGRRHRRRVVEAVVGVPPVEESIDGEDQPAANV